MAQVQNIILEPVGDFTVLVPPVYGSLPCGQIKMKHAKHDSCQSRNTVKTLEVHRLRQLCDLQLLSQRFQRRISVF